MTHYKIHMPETASPGDCLGAFGTALSAIGLELGQTINEGMTESFGKNWMFILEDARAAEAAQVGKVYKKSFSPFDFSWIINETYHNPQSPVKDFLPWTAYNFFKNARELVETRNRWYHDYNPHNINDLTKALELCVYMASKCQLSVQPAIEAVRQRALELKAGTYQPTPGNGAPDQTQPGASNPPSRSSSPVVQRAVGAVWLGDLPERKISLKATGSLIDEKLQTNVTSELIEAQHRYLNLWKLIIMPGWLWVDELGQVATFVQGVLRCVGFWGEQEEPPQDPSSKFLLPHSYELNSSSLIDRATGAVLNEDEIGKVTESTLKRARLVASDSQLVRVTWDGDLIWFSGNGVEYFGELESKDWFPSHFAVETA